MASIGSRVFVSGGTKKYLTLTNEEHVRFIGTDWNSVRIGLLVALNTNGVADLTGRFGVGLCNGQTNPSGTNPTTNFVGYKTNAPGTWTYTANTGNPYFLGQQFYGLRRAGNVDVTSTAGGTNMLITTVTGGAIQRRSLVYVDINRNSTQKSYSTSSAQFTNDFSYADFLAGLEYGQVNTTPVIRTLTMASASSQTVLVDETTGVFNSVDIIWTGLQAMEIYALGVYRKT